LRQGGTGSWRRHHCPLPWPSAVVADGGDHTSRTFRGVFLLAFAEEPVAMVDVEREALSVWPWLSTSRDRGLCVRRK